jgi:2-polyprenyl-6-methoxyphenol hydroxylase-like FAD-dependent oxidoreductase
MNSGKAFIAGGSVGGLFAGVLLQRLGWDVSIYERSESGLAGKGAGLVLQEEVYQILHEIGHEDVARMGVVAHERIFLDKTGTIIHTMRTPQSQISWDLLFSAFRTKVPNDHYHLGEGIRGVDLSRERPTIHFSNGTKTNADLVVGADGIGSVVRNSVAPGTELQYAGYVAFRGLSPETELPEDSARIVSGRFTFYDSPGSQFLGYLVAGTDGNTEPGRRRYNWVWYRSLTNLQLREALTSDEGEQRSYSAPPSGISRGTREGLHAAAHKLLPPVLRDIVMREQFPFIQAIFDYETPSMYRSRIALLGDAAFVVRPHTAMGVSKAAGDAMALRDVLQEERSLEKALHRYQETRLPVGKAIAKYGRELGKRVMQSGY